MTETQIVSSSERFKKTAKAIAHGTLSVVTATSSLVIEPNTLNSSDPFFFQRFPSNPDKVQVQPNEQKYEIKSIEYSQSNQKIVMAFTERDLEEIDIEALSLIINKAYGRAASLLGEPYDKITVGRESNSICQPACAYPNRAFINSSLTQSWIAEHPKDLEDYLTHELAHAIAYGWDYLSSQGIAEAVNRITSGAEAPKEKDFGSEHDAMVKSVRAYMKIEKKYPGFLKNIGKLYNEWSKSCSLERKQTNHFMPEELAIAGIESFRSGLWLELQEEMKKAE